MTGVLTQTQTSDKLKTANNIFLIYSIFQHSGIYSESDGVSAPLLHIYDSYLFMNQ